MPVARGRSFCRTPLSFLRSLSAFSAGVLRFVSSCRSTAVRLLGGHATGGRAALADGLANPRGTRHFLRTSLGDRLAKVLPSTPSKACGLLVRVRRKRSGAIRVTVLGRVIRIHHFDGEPLADAFQIYVCPGVSVVRCLRGRCLDAGNTRILRARQNSVSLHPVRWQTLPCVLADKLHNRCPASRASP